MAPKNPTDLGHLVTNTIYRERSIFTIQIAAPVSAPTNIALISVLISIGARMYVDMEAVITAAILCAIILMYLNVLFQDKLKNITQKAAYLLHHIRAYSH